MLIGENENTAEKDQRKEESNIGIKGKAIQIREDFKESEASRVYTLRSYPFHSHVIKPLNPSP